MLRLDWVLVISYRQCKYLDAQFRSGKEGRTESELVPRGIAVGQSYLLFREFSRKTCCLGIHALYRQKSDRRTDGHNVVPKARLLRSAKNKIKT